MIQLLKMFFRISFRVFSKFYTGTKELPFQGRVQGNRAIPPIWLIISILLIRYLYGLKLISVIKISITQLVFQLVGFLYIDDTNLILMNDGKESTVEIISRA